MKAKIEFVQGKKSFKLEADFEYREDPVYEDVGGYSQIAETIKRRFSCGKSTKIIGSISDIDFAKAFSIQVSCMLSGLRHPRGFGAAYHFAAGADVRASTGFSGSWWIDHIEVSEIHPLTSTIVRYRG